MKGRSVKELLFYALLIYLMVISLNLAVMDSAGMNLPAAKMALLSFAAVSAALLAVLYPAALLVAAAAAAGWGGYLYFEKPLAWNAAISDLAGFLNWLYGYIVGYRHFEAEYTLVFAGLYMTFAAVLITVIVLSGRGRFLLMLLGTAALSFFWFIYVEKARLYLMLYLFAALILYSYHIYKRKKKEWDQEGNITEPKVMSNWMLCAAAVIAFSILSSLLLPLNISPFHWDWLNGKMVGLFPFISEWRNDAADSYSYGFSSRYGISVAGYDGRNPGGPVRLDDSVMLTVETDSRESIYFRGVVKTRYDGFAWSKPDRKYAEYSPGAPMPAPEGFEGVKAYPQTFRITPQKLLTSTIFAPFSLYEVQEGAGKIFMDKDAEAYFSRVAAPGSSYTVKSMIPYLDEAALQSPGRESSPAGTPYLTLPGNISGRVKALAAELTEGRGSDYEKAKAIEGYLRSRYRYTLKPGKVPQNREFADYFLFEGKEGYCTYFATAMGVLLRASGIPCRYVEGFLSKYEDSATRNIRGMDAHAWVEAYFAGYGWMTFEATPQYPEVFYQRPEIEAAVPDGTAEEQAAAGGLDIPGSARGGRRLTGEEETEETAPENETHKKFKFGNNIIYVLFALLLLRILQTVLRRLSRELSIRRASGMRFAVCYLEDLQYHFRKIGFALEPDETLRELFIRIRRSHRERFAELQQVTELIEKARYGGSDLAKPEREILEAFRMEIKRFALSRQGLIRFMVTTYLVGR